MEVEHDTPAKWQDELYDLLRRNKITQFAYVPDAGHRILMMALRKCLILRRLAKRGLEGRATFFQPFRISDSLKSAANFAASDAADGRRRSRFSALRLTPGQFDPGRRMIAWCSRPRTSRSTPAATRRPASDGLSSR